MIERCSVALSDSSRSGGEALRLAPVDEGIGEGSSRNGRREIKSKNADTYADMRQPSGADPLYRQWWNAASRENDCACI